MKKITLTLALFSVTGFAFDRGQDGTGGKYKQTTIKIEKGGNTNKEAAKSKETT